MRKLSLIVAVLTAAALFGSPVGAQSENAYSKSTGGVGYLALGSPDARAMFVAMGTSEDAKGRINAQNQGGVNNVANFKGRVDCYQPVSANQATFSGEITHFEEVSPGATNRNYFRVAVFDAGSPGAIGDMIQIQRSNDPFDCTEDYNPGRPVTNGNLVVHHDNANQ